MYSSRKRKVVDRIHTTKSISVVSDAADKYLLSLGYEKQTSNKYLSLFYSGETYDTRVSVYPEKIYIYQEYKCGGKIGEKDIIIPDNVVENKQQFKLFYEESLEYCSYLFD